MSTSREELADRLEAFLRVLESARRCENKAISVWSGDVEVVSEALDVVRLAATPKAGVDREVVALGGVDQPVLRDALEKVKAIAEEIAMTADRRDKAASLAEMLKIINAALSPGGGDGYCGCTERCKDRDNCQYEVKPDLALEIANAVLNVGRQTPKLCNAHQLKAARDVLARHSAVSQTDALAPDNAGLVSRGGR